MLEIEGTLCYLDHQRVCPRTCPLWPHVKDAFQRLAVVQHESDREILIRYSVVSRLLGDIYRTRLARSRRAELRAKGLGVCYHENRSNPTGAA